jgi:hypothetical protein
MELSTWQVSPGCSRSLVAQHCEAGKRGLRGPDCPRRTMSEGCHGTPRGQGTGRALACSRWRCELSLFTGAACGSGAATYQ